MIEIGLKTRADVERLILQAGHVGISQTEIRNKLRISRPTVFVHCRALEMAGKVEKTGKAGRWVVWGAPGIRAAHTKEVPPRKTPPSRWQEAKNAAHWAEGWTEEPPVHRRIPANEAAPLGKPGVSSVWELAA